MIHDKLKVVVVIIILVTFSTIAVIFIDDTKPKRHTPDLHERNQMTYYKDSLAAEYYKQKLSE